MAVVSNSSSSSSSSSSNSRNEGSDVPPLAPRRVAGAGWQRVATRGNALCCAALRCGVLRCVVLRCPALRCAVPRRATSRCAVQLIPATQTALPRFGFPSYQADKVNPICPVALRKRMTDAVPATLFQPH